MNYKRLHPDFIHLEVVDSTNTFAANLLKESKPLNGTTILSKRQTAGRGQRGNLWSSDPDLNLTFSVILFPEISVPQIFALNMAVSLAVSKALEDYKIETHIKWPNDILAGSKKVAGILIENQFRADQVISSVVGVGVNVNQTEFGPALNACSLKSVAAKEFDLDGVFGKIYQQLDFYVNILMEKNLVLLSKRYHEKLFGLNEIRQFQDKAGKFEGLIRGVDENGFIRIERAEGIKKYDLKEVQFLF